MTVRRQRLTAVAALLLGVTVLVGCKDETGPAPAPAPAAVRAPALGACYRLTVADGLQLSSSVPRVPCSRRHTATTVAVGTVPRKVAGTAAGVESPAAQRRVAQTCRAKVDAHAGGSRETRRLSRVQAVWFSPPPDQLAAGARWFRCDLVIAGDGTNFTALPRKTRGMLDGPTALNRYGTCGTTAPSARGFRRVTCSVAHTWRVRASIDLPSGTRYLGASAGKQADARCRDVAARRAATVTRLRWSFEWPTRAQWSSGQRYGLCWTPD